MKIAPFTPNITMRRAKDWKRDGNYSKYQEMFKYGVRKKKEEKYINMMFAACYSMVSWKCRQVLSHTLRTHSAIIIIIILCTAVDALRDPTIQDIMLRNAQPLSPRAYLALYLAVLIERTKQIQDGRYKYLASPRERFLQAYLNYLPTYQDFADFHPVLTHHQQQQQQQQPQQQHYNNNNNSEPSSSRFYVDHLILQLQRQMEHDYQSFCEATQSVSGQVIHIHNNNNNEQDTTVRYIDWQQYVTARLLVQTRSFTAGALSQYDVTADELQVFGKHILPEAVVVVQGQGQGGGKTTSRDDALRQALASAMVPLLVSTVKHRRRR
jgi:hypothetical protein